MKIEFTVPGPPVGKARARAGNGRHYTPQKTRDYESMVKMLASEAMAGRPLMQGPVYVVIEARCPRSKAVEKREAKEKGPVAMTSKPDLDNVAKSILDGLNGIVFNDDSQVDEMRLRKVYATDPGVFVSAWSVY